MSWRTKSRLAWLRELPGVSEHEALASRTSFGIGGPAEFFVELARPEAIEKAIDGTRVRAGAGLKMMRLARIVADANLRGFEFAIGVPGTVGGAVYQDAGCWGKEMREVLVEAEGYLPGTGKQTWRPAALELGYRTSALRDGPLKGALVLNATIQLERGDGEEAKKLM